MFTRFDRMYERDRKTDTYTDRQTDGHRMTAKAALDACITRHKITIFDQYLALSRKQYKI